MKKILMCTLLLGMFSVGFVGYKVMNDQTGALSFNKGAVHLGYHRPFSFYYPYNYQYYYPHVQNYGRNYYGGNSCHWVYTNGTYVYSCN